MRAIIPGGYLIVSGTQRSPPTITSPRAPTSKRPTQHPEALSTQHSFLLSFFPSPRLELGTRSLPRNHLENTPSKRQPSTRGSQNPPLTATTHPHTETQTQSPTVPTQQAANPHGTTATPLRRRPRDVRSVVQDSSSTSTSVGLGWGI